MNEEAVRRYIAAKGYKEAVKMVHLSPFNRSEAERSMTVLPMGLLAAFSLELYFKAWLLQSGVGSAAVRAYGHALRRLYSDARAAALPDIAGLSDVVANFASNHEDYSFRYLETNDSFGDPNWLVVFQIMDSLDLAVDSYVGVSTGRGLPPGRYRT